MSVDIDTTSEDVARNVNSQTPAVKALVEVMDDLIDDFSVSSSSGSSGYSSTDTVSEIWDQQEANQEESSNRNSGTTPSQYNDSNLTNASLQNGPQDTNDSPLARTTTRTTTTTTGTTTTELRIPSHQRFGSLIHKHEIPRKVFHSSIGFVTLWLYTQGYQVNQITPVLVAGLVAVGGADYLRFSNASFNQLYVKVMGFMMREKEVSQINGVVYYLLGLILVFLVFPKDICLLAVLLLSWADTAASTIGRAYGKYTPKLTQSKSLAGSLAAFVVGCASTFLLYSFFIPAYSEYNHPDQIMWTPQTSRISLNWLVFAAGFITAASEAVDVCDDNFSIPVLSAIFMYAFVWANRV